MSGSIGGPSPFQSAQGVDLSISGPLSSEQTASEMPPPAADLPSEVSGPIKREDITVSCREAQEAPEGSAVRETSKALEAEISLGGSLIGISGKNLKENFKSAWNADKQIKSKPLRWLKRAGRVTGLVLGATINLAAKVVAFSVAAAVSTTAVVFYTLGLVKLENSSLVKDPRGTLAKIFAAGAGVGAFAGSSIGMCGSLLVNASLNMERASFDQVLQDNAFAAAAGAGVGSLASVANPLMWRAAWVPMKEES